MASAAFKSLAQSEGRWRRVVIGLACAAATVAGAFGAADFLGDQLRADIRRDATAEANFRAAILSRHLQQFRDVPKVLAEERDVKAAIALAPTAPQVEALSARLERLIDQTQVEAIYLLGPDGVTRAASNWRAARSFVGRDYNFRPYFSEAREHGAYEFFALGTVSAEPGLYIAQRVDGAGGVGVLVVKVHLDDVEAEWSRSPGQVAVTDQRGIVILASVPDWRFGRTRSLSTGEMNEILRTRQFGDAPKLPLISLPAQEDAANGAMAIARPIENSAWTLTYLVPTTPIEAAQRIGFVLGALVGLLASIGLLALDYWRRRSAAARRRDEAARQELEARVAERTRDLAEANTRLMSEIGERKRVEMNAQTLQDELIQANRLAVLGQISAGVAHEVNQPLAAIRAFADNANTLLDRDEREEVRANLASISDLATRIAAITDELRAMSRKSVAPRENVPVAQAIDGALVLIGARARACGVRIERVESGDPVVVLAHRMRLEQVLLNLLQNALDACVGVADPQIRITTEAHAAEVTIDVADNGPGIAPEAASGLFTPFQTTKPQGLGLGLVISQDICREYGGRLVSIASPLGGAAFRIALPAHP